MTTADSHIGSNRQHRLSDQVPANTHNTRARRKGARDSGPSAAASTSPPAPGVSGEHLILYGSGLAGLGSPAPGPLPDALAADTRGHFAEIADKFLFLSVNRDHWLLLGQTKAL